MMPAWGSQLGEQGVKEVANYVLSLSGRTVDKQLAAAGQHDHLDGRIGRRLGQSIGDALAGGVSEAIDRGVIESDQRDRAADFVAGCHDVRGLVEIERSYFFREN